MQIKKTTKTGVTASDNKLLNQLNEKFEQLDKDRKQADLDFEGSMCNDFSKLFADEFGAEVDDSTYREHGWYYVDFILNNKKGVLYYYPSTNGGDIRYANKYISKDYSPLSIDDLFNKFHKLLDKLDKQGANVKSSTSTEKACQHIKAAIDILATEDSEVAKDSIANLATVMFDIKGSTKIDK